MRALFDASFHVYQDGHSVPIILGITKISRILSRLYSDRVGRCEEPYLQRKQFWNHQDRKS